VNGDAQAVNKWGYWATTAWAAVAFLVGQFAALTTVVLWRSAKLNAIIDTPYDGVLVTLFILISNPITVAILWLAARLARAQAIDYLGLHWPQAREVTRGIVVLIGLIAVSDALLYLSGRDLVTPFQLQSYTTAAAEGWLPAMLVAAIVVAPAGEEVLFRGFLFRGYVQSERSAWPAIVAISLLWAALHIQYDWTGILQIFVIGLFLGWMRWRSGSTLLTLLLHTLFNLEGTLETVLQIRFFS
jgi:membrane protease YdiL (CAAX protease family)